MSHRLIRYWAGITAGLVIGGTGLAGAASATDNVTATLSRAGAVSAAQCNATVTKIDAQMRRPTHFVVPTRQDPAKSMKGKIIANMEVAPVPTVEAVGRGIQAAGKLLGAKVLTYIGANGGTVQSWNQELKLALERGATYITFFSIPIPDVAATLKKAGSKIHFVDIEDTASLRDPLVAGDFVHVGVSTQQEGSHQAIGALAATHCQLHALAYTYPELPNNRAITASAVATVHHYCPTTCTIKTVDLLLSQNQSAFDSELATDITKNPNTNYVLPSNDFIGLQAAPVLKTKRIPEASVNCDPPNYPLLEQHNVELQDVCQPPFSYIGFAAVDELVRAADGLPAARYTLPVQLLGPNTTFNPKTFYAHFGNYTKAFEKLWHVG